MYQIQKTIHLLNRPARIEILCESDDLESCAKLLASVVSTRENMAELNSNAVVLHYPTFTIEYRLVKLVELPLPATDDRS
jgi:hypothetical protein